MLEKNYIRKPLSALRPPSIQGQVRTLRLALYQILNSASFENDVYIEFDGIDNC